MAVYTDRWLGLSIERPQGFSCEKFKGALHVKGDPLGFVDVSVWPLRGPVPPVDALVTAVLSLAKQKDPTLAAWRAPAPEPDGSLSVRTIGTHLGKRVEGRWHVSSRPGSGLVAGFRAPPEVLEKIAPIAAQVLGSIQPAPLIGRTFCQDPTEGAFGILVPEGFRARAGITRASGTPQATFECADSSGVLKVAVPPGVYQFAEPVTGMGMLGALFGMGGMGMGMGGNMFASMGMPQLAYSSASQFARTWLVPRLRPGARIESCDERQDIDQQGQVELAKRGLLGMVDSSSAVVQFVHPDKGDIARGAEGGASDIEHRERALVSVSRLRGYGSWHAYLCATVSAPTAQWDEWEPVLSGVADSFEENPQWRANEDARVSQNMLQQQQQNFQRLQQAAQTQRETSDIIIKGHERRQAIQDKMHHNFSNVIRGQQDMVDDTGQKWNVPVGHDRYWRDNLGNVIGGSWGTNPDPTWHRMELDRG